MLRPAVGILLVAVLTGGCAPRYFVQVAEGLTSPTLTEGIRVTPRMFTAPQLVEACTVHHPVERLEVVSDDVEMQQDGRYALDSLGVVAVNGGGTAMEDVPIVIEAEADNPPVVQLRSDDADVNAGRLHALRHGTFHIRIRTTCGVPHVEKIVEFHVLR